ncbi:hypothetical protein Y1Q_0020849 [Alligator mississippiensis]|uniref:Uncharacterized protein n=1 Tax=Alligator mississippiensis TaxID=8496 RepID=A0A151NJ37_ALLMI|nr:hypothetical protein Y1Q_0020849 [Alligator mississippiensis]
MTVLESVRKAPEGPAFECRRKATFGSQDEVSGSPQPTAGALQTALPEDDIELHFILLQQLVVAPEDWLEDSQTWWAEDVTRDDMQDWADQEFQAQLLALEHECLGLLREQNAILTWAVQATDDDR